MYQENDLIIYGATGVCRVLSVGHPDHLPEANGDLLYYTLAPVYSTGLIYAPLNTTVYMRPVLTREDAQRLIARIPSISELPCPASQRLLAEHYRASFASHRCEDLVGLLKTIYRKNQLLRSRGKKPGQVDQHYQKRAEELLYSELSVSLEIPREAVPQYISEHIPA